MCRFGFGHFIFLLLLVEKGSSKSEPQSAITAFRPDPGERSPTVPLSAQTPGGSTLPLRGLSDPRVAVGHTTLFVALAPADHVGLLARQA